MRKLFLRASAWLRFAAIALLVPLLLAACQPSAPPPPKSMTAGITGYNFTDEGVQEYFVNGSYGSNLPPYGGGGATSCCVSLPAQWSPSATVKVDWTIGHWTKPFAERRHLSVDAQIVCCWTERTLSKTVAVERYEESGKLQVFFLPNDEIAVYVYEAGPQHPDHPSRMGYPRNPNPVSNP